MTKELSETTAEILEFGPDEIADVRQVFLRADRQLQLVVALRGCLLIGTKIYDSFQRAGARAERAALGYGRLAAFILQIETDDLEPEIKRLADLAEEIEPTTKSGVIQRICRIINALREDRLFEASFELLRSNDGALGRWIASELQREAIPRVIGEVELPARRGFFPTVLAMVFILPAGAPWSPWFRIFRNVAAGEFSHWGLARAIAEIPDTVWDAGATAVAVEIERIEANFLKDSTPQDRTIVFDLYPAVFRSVPTDPVKSDLYEATLARMQDALEDVLSEPANGLSERSRETRVLTRMLSRYRNDPQRVEMDCTSIERALTRQMLVTEELPQSEDNIALRSAVQAAAQGIRATHKPIAENRAILDQQAFRELDPEKIGEIETAAPVLARMADHALAEEIAESAFVLTEDMRLPRRPTLGAAERNPGLVPVDDAVRFFSISASMLLILRKSDEAVDRLAARMKVSRDTIFQILAAMVVLGISILMS